MASLFIPWTVTFGTNTIGYRYSYHFEIYKFPFMAYYVVLTPIGSEAWWEPHQNTLEYLGAVLMTLSSVIVIIGGIKEKFVRLLTGGVTLSFFALVFFSFDSAVVYIQNAPLVQNYTIVPLGMFIPPLSWIVILFYPEKETLTKPASTMYCGQCGMQVPTSFNLCPYCGSKLWKPICPTCGREVSPEHNFCPYCGSRLT